MNEPPRTAISRRTKDVSIEHVDRLLGKLLPAPVVSERAATRSLSRCH